MDIYAIFMGAAFAGMAVFFGLLIVLFRAWTKSKERPAASSAQAVRVASSAAAPTRRESTPVASSMRERELSELLSAVTTLTREMEETANAMFRRFEQKERRLEQLMKEAEDCAGRLESRKPVSSSVVRESIRRYSTVEDMPPAPVARPLAQPVAEQPARATASGKYAKAAEMMALGKSASDVSRELSLHVGELELINNLRKIGM